MLWQPTQKILISMIDLLSISSVFVQRSLLAIFSAETNIQSIKSCQILIEPSVVRGLDRSLCEATIDLDKP